MSNNYYRQLINPYIHISQAPYKSQLITHRPFRSYKFCPVNLPYT